MKYIKTYKQINENMEDNSNGYLNKIHNGTYNGWIKGYDIYNDSNECLFKCTTGLRNAYPVKCVSIIHEGHATVYYKDGILFSDNEIQDKWKQKYNSLDNDPLFKSFSKQLSS